VKAVDKQVSAINPKVVSNVLAATLVLVSIIFNPNNLIFFFIGVTLSVIAGYHTIPILRQMKFGQTVRTDGPQSHQKKNGTPTMGGLFFMPIAVFVPLVLTGFNSDVVACSAITMAYFLVGFWDDYTIVVQKHNAGISPKTKLVCQFVFGSLFMGWYGLTHTSPIIDLYGLSVTLPIVVYCLLGVILLAGMSNATNLTDGIDGLCGGVTSIVAVFLSCVALVNHQPLATMLLVLSGCCTGFLVFNTNPAKVFMGDTGSLAIGGMLASSCLVTGQILPLIVVGLVFIIETLSVMIQSSYFKYTRIYHGKGVRIFKLTPYHHHLECHNWDEVSIVILAYAFTGMMGLITILL
jgi:phospho-N-acetylmuramoyl-pentapeptide-transferase